MKGNLLESKEVREYLDKFNVEGACIMLNEDDRQVACAVLTQINLACHVLFLGRNNTNPNDVVVLKAKFLPNDLSTLASCYYEEHDYKKAYELLKYSTQATSGSEFKSILEDHVDILKELFDCGLGCPKCISIIKTHIFVKMPFDKFKATLLEVVAKAYSVVNPTEHICLDIRDDNGDIYPIPRTIEEYYSLYSRIESCETWEEYQDIYFDIYDNRLSYGALFTDFSVIPSRYHGE